jgi:chromosome segregation ATPase
MGMSAGILEVRFSNLSAKATTDEEIGTIPQTLATLHARLRGLETENALCRRRVRELEGELDRARSEVQDARKDGDRRLREVVSEKTGLSAVEA